jgi:hypothetical protein
VRAVTAQFVSMLSTVAALLFLAGIACASTDVVGQFFEKVKGQGTPVAGRVKQDGSADVDVYAGGKVTRFHFDTDGKVTSAASPLVVDAKLLDAVKTSAADASKAAVDRAQARESAVRAVTLVVDGGVAAYHVASYDAGHRFIGYHRFLAADGKWDGWYDAAGEPDPAQ